MSAVGTVGNAVKAQCETVQPERFKLIFQIKQEKKFAISRLYNSYDVEGKERQVLKNRKERQQKQMEAAES